MKALRILHECGALKALRNLHECGALKALNVGKNIERSNDMTFKNLLAGVMIEPPMDVGVCMLRPYVSPLLMKCESYRSGNEKNFGRKSMKRKLYTQSLNLLRKRLAS